MFVLPGFLYLGCKLSYTVRILRVDINSTADCEAGVLLFRVIQYTWRNCWTSFSVGEALTFFQSSLQGVHKSFSLFVKLLIEWSGSDMIDLVWFVEVFKLTRCKLASIVRHYDVYYTKSCELRMKKFTVISVVGFLHLCTSGYFEKLSTTMK